MQFRFSGDITQNIMLQCNDTTDGFTIQLYNHDQIQPIIDLIKDHQYLYQIQIIVDVKYDNIKRPDQ